MEPGLKPQIIELGRQAHAMTEAAYQQNPATRGGPGWQEKQRILLADMALHLLQTALKDGALAPQELKRNLYAILTIADQFIPESGLKAHAAQHCT